MLTSCQVEIIAFEGRETRDIYCVQCADASRHEEAQIGRSRYDMEEEFGDVGCICQCGKELVAAPEIAEDCE